MVISKLRGYYIFVSNILILEREMGASHFSPKGNELLVECDEPTTRLHWAVSLKPMWLAGLLGVLVVKQR